MIEETIQSLINDLQAIIEKPWGIIDEQHENTDKPYEILDVLCEGIDKQQESMIRRVDEA